MERKRNTGLDDKLNRAHIDEERASKAREAVLGMAKGQGAKREAKSPVEAIVPSWLHPLGTFEKVGEALRPKAKSQAKAGAGQGPAALGIRPGYKK